MNSRNSNSSSESNQDTVSSSPINPNFECDNGYYYLSKPESVSADNTHRYYEYPWQSDLMICINAYEPPILGNRLEKVQAFIGWVTINMPNIIPGQCFLH